MKHYIIVKFREEVTKAQKAEMLPRIAELFAKTEQLDGVDKAEVLPNVTDRANRFDLMIVITMSPDALPTYDECVWHKQWKEEYGDLIEKKTIIDT